MNWTDSELFSNLYIPCSCDVYHATINKQFFLVAVWMDCGTKTTSVKFYYPDTSLAEMKKDIESLFDLDTLQTVC